MNALRLFPGWMNVKSVSPAVALLLLLGCGSKPLDTRPVDAPPPPPPSASRASNVITASTPSSFRNDLRESSQQIDRVLWSLNTLTDPATQDLRAALDN